MLGRFPVTRSGNRWIIVCTDYLTRFTVTKALPTGEAIEVAKFIVEEIILKHGSPKEMISDRGRTFLSNLVKTINELCQTSHLLTTAYHPQTNGLTERFNKTLADMLSMYTDVEQKNWDTVLPFVTFAYNSAKQNSTGFSPYFLIYGRNITTPLDVILPQNNDQDHDDSYVQQLITRSEEARQLAKIYIKDAQASDKRRYDARHRSVSYEIGDLVWVYTPIRKVGLSEKLLRRYFGPYRITRHMSEVTYEVESMETDKKRRKLKDAVHVLRIKPYYEPKKQLGEEQHVAGKYSANEFEFTRELCLKLGLYYGIQNDYLDCFGEPEVTGKIGNDIAEGKCTWCSVKFLEAASEPMKKEFFVGLSFYLSEMAAINIMCL
ncbi:Retrovirus-related Pol polyprotein from transposon 412 [Araneus ventricosus]|uniref:Retrovirus-related Pol polyprotein from transposon 412 n=1 Tax=Araneus ventricosus TaxID=182803 RepID=A0A4Y2IJ28_ARAVE|nr:Retrovirus-related Pol polyprotein from transposon 412 [Araneus ventricosus]